MRLGWSRWRRRRMGGDLIGGDGWGVPRGLGGAISGREVFCDGE